MHTADPLLRGCWMRSPRLQCLVIFVLLHRLVVRLDDPQAVSQVERVLADLLDLLRRLVHRCVSKVEVGLRYQGLADVHHLGVHHWFRNLLPALHHVVHNDHSSVGHLKVLVGESVEHAGLPLGRLVDLLTQLGRGGGEHCNGSACCLDDLLILVGHQQNHVLHLVVLSLVPLHLHWALAEVEHTLDGCPAKHLVILVHVLLDCHHTIGVLQHPSPHSLIHIGEVAQSQEGLKVLDRITLLLQQLCNRSDGVTAPLSRECNGWILADANPGKTLSCLVLTFLCALKGKRDQGLAATLLDDKTTKVGVFAEGVQHPSNQLLHVLALRLGKDGQC